MSDEAVDRIRERIARQQQEQLQQQSASLQICSAPKACANNASAAPSRFGSAVALASAAGITAERGETVRRRETVRQQLLAFSAHEDAALRLLFDEVDVNKDGLISGMEWMKGFSGKRAVALKPLLQPFRDPETWRELNLQGEQQYDFDQFKQAMAAAAPKVTALWIATCLCQINCFVLSISLGNNTSINR